MHRHFIHVEILGHRRQLSSGHQAAGRHHRHHHVHQPEMRRRSHLSWLEVHRALANFYFWASLLSPRLRQPSSRRSLEKQRSDYHDGSLNDSPHDERMLVAGTSGLSRGINHISDGRDREGGSGTECPLRLDRRASPRWSGNHFSALPMRRAVHDAGAKSCNRIREIKC